MKKMQYYTINNKAVQGCLYTITQNENTNNTHLTIDLDFKRHFQHT